MREDWKGEGLMMVIDVGVEAVSGGGGYEDVFLVVH